jgi:hypothetical protein
MGTDRHLSAEEWAEIASTLITVSERQQLVCEELLARLGTTLDETRRGTNELTRNAPGRIAHQAALEVIEGVGDSVKQSVADVLRPAEASSRTLVRAMEEAATTYKRAARDAVVTCTLYACASAAGAAVVTVLAMKTFGIF